MCMWVCESHFQIPPSHTVFISFSFENTLTCESYASQKAFYACPITSLFVKSKIFPGYVETHIEKILHISVGVFCSDNLKIGREMAARGAALKGNMGE